MMLGAKGQVIDIPAFPVNYVFGSADGISGDGLTVVGSIAKAGFLDPLGFVWNKNTKATTFLAPLGGDTVAGAGCSNYDASFLGGASSGGGGGVVTAVYWHNGGPAVDTGVNNTNTCTVIGVSDDGTHLVIRYFDGVLTKGYAWNSGVATQLAEPPNGEFANGNCHPLCISGDGTMIGGFYTKSVAGVPTRPPVLWNAATGAVISVLTFPGGWASALSAAVGFLNHNASAGFIFSGAAGGNTCASSRAFQTFFNKGIPVGFPVPMTQGVWTGGASFTIVAVAPENALSATQQFIRQPTVGGAPRHIPQPARISPWAADFGVVSQNGLAYATTRSNGLGGQPIYLSMLA